jgi:hypothetical protein
MAHTHIPNFDAKVRAKMAAILAKEEEDAIEAEAYRRILEERRAAEIESSDIKVLARLAGECWADIEESYPNIRHLDSGGYQMAGPSHSTCKICNNTSSVVYAVAARRKIMDIIEARAAAAEQRYVHLPVYSKFNPVLEYLKNNPAVSHNIRTLLFVDYPGELKKMYGLDVSHIIAKYERKITAKHFMQEDIRQCVKEYILAEATKN